jgi:hypothetical protein
MLFNRWGSICHYVRKACMVACILMLAGSFLAVMNQPVKAAQDELNFSLRTRPGLRFTSGDTGVCIPEPAWIEATVIVSLPENMTARLQVSYHVVRPKRTDITYTHPGIVKDGDRYTFSAYWPGIQPGEKSVEIHWGAALLDVQTGQVMATAGMDYFWYPYICEPHAPTKTPAATATPVMTATAAPLPDLPSRLPTLAPPSNPEDRYAVLPETGDDRRTGASIHFVAYVGIMLIGGRFVLQPLKKFFS